MRTEDCPRCKEPMEPAERPGWFSCPTCNSYMNSQEWFEGPEKRQR